VQPPTVQPLTVQAPVVQPPTVQPLTVQAPVVQPPVVEAPVVQAPVVQPPVVEAPVVQPPVVEAPVVEAPVVEPPSVQPPSVQPPVVEAPVVQPPVVEAPVVEAPGVQPPTLQAPVVQPTPAHIAEPVADKREIAASAAQPAALEQTAVQATSPSPQVRTTGAPEGPVAAPAPKENPQVAQQPATEKATSAAKPKSKPGAFTSSIEGPEDQPVIKRRAAEPASRESSPVDPKSDARASAAKAGATGAVAAAAVGAGAVASGVTDGWGADLEIPVDDVQAKQATAALLESTESKPSDAREEILALYEETLEGMEGREAPAQKPAEASKKRRRRLVKPTRKLIKLPSDLEPNDPGAAAYLLSIPSMMVLVDGESVAAEGWKRGPGLSPADHLVNGLAAVAERTDARFEVVFDGAQTEVTPTLVSRRRVRVRFARGGVTVSDVVSRLADAFPIEQPIVVVTSTQSIRDTAAKARFNTVSAHQMCEVIKS